MVAHPETKYEHSAVQQSDYDILLGSIKQKEDITLRKEYEIAFVFKNEELKEFLEDIAADKSVKLASSDHAIGLVYESETQEYVLFDPNGFLNEQTQEHFFEKRFSSDKVEDLIKHIQSAFLYEPDSEVTSIVISIFDDSEKPMPTYFDRVEVINQKLEERKVLELLLNSVQGPSLINFQAEDKPSLLYIAAENGYLEIAELLLKQGAKIGAGKLLNPIHIAIINGHDAVAKLLLNSPEAQETPLELIIQNGRFEILKWLLKEKRNIQGDKSQALRLAARAGQVKIVQWLLQQGVKVSSDSLELAVEYGHNAVVELLLDSQVQTMNSQEFGKGHFCILQLLIIILK